MPQRALNILEGGAPDAYDRDSRHPRNRRQRRARVRAQNIDDTVCHQQRIARIGNQTYQAMGNPNTPLGSSQKHYTAIRGETATIEPNSDFLASDGWKPERLSRIVMHGGCGSV
jgi:hypothetical protein